MASGQHREFLAPLSEHRIGSVEDPLAMQLNERGEGSRELTLAGGL
jgi:hypothetical protein